MSKMSLKIKIPFSCGVEYKDRIYLSALDRNELFQYDLENNEMQYIVSFEKEDDKEYLYRTAILYQNEAWFIPNQADNIAIVNLDTYEIQYIPLQYNWINDVVRLKCASAGIYREHYLYVVPYDIDAVSLINMQTKELEVINGISAKDNAYMGGYFNDGFLYCIPWTAKYIWKINVESKEKQKLKWEYKEKQFGDVIVDEQSNEIWLIPADLNSLVRLDPKCNLIDEQPLEILNAKEVSREIKSYYGKMIENRIFIFPFNGNKVYAYDIKKKDVTEYDGLINDDKEIHFMKLIDGNGFFLIMENTSFVFFYDEKKDCFEKKEIVLNLTENYRCIRLNKMEVQIKGKNNIYEKTSGELSDFLKLI